MTSVLKFQSPFERLKFANPQSDIALRKAIILQAIIDASNTSNNTELKKYENEAKNWIFGKDSSFCLICEQAGLAPDFVTKIAKELIALHQQQMSAKNTKHLFVRNNTHKIKNIA